MRSKVTSPKLDTLQYVFNLLEQHILANEPIPSALYQLVTTLLDKDDTNITKKDIVECYLASYPKL